MHFFIIISALLFSSAIAAPVVLSRDTRPPRPLPGLGGPHPFDQIFDGREEVGQDCDACGDGILENM
ncbi:hypothetical protein GYMLUDRAFT_49644 [Collybiopsis luxurians FD-317 M1]|uniref:Uncharacterized protein n=1 Tax=Collybiopsis luxurians FD-317 M1 TaxID=944289 RepID=A0A0D0CDG0_9AGAR|nr:hypothetical protein GYMLUDRAFT_49644 [Collybiopsis luxurians FD-317 M1]